MSKLTPKQAKFVEEYLIDFNATQAAVRAGYSERTAKQTGYENLTKPYIQEAIQNYQKQLTVEAGVTPEKIVKELTFGAFFDLRKLFDKDGIPLPIKNLPTEVAAAIASIDIITHKDGSMTYKIKPVNKNDSLDKLMRTLGMFNPDKSQDKPSQITLIMPIPRDPGDE